MVGKHLEVPRPILAQLRAICRLPDAYEEAAWVGTRWRIRKKTFAHVLMIDAGWPPAYARAAGSGGPVCVLTFRSSLAEFDPNTFRQPPFFKPVWWPDIAGMVLDGRTGWDDVAKSLVASYRVLAPRKLWSHMSAT